MFSPNFGLGYANKRYHSTALQLIATILCIIECLIVGHEPLVHKDICGKHCSCPEQVALAIACDFTADFSHGPLSESRPLGVFQVKDLCVFQVVAGAVLMVSVGVD
jgi:hypothetical protein